MTYATSNDPAVAAVISYARERATLPSPALRSAIRRDANVTLAQAASALNVTPSAVWLWETGQRMPRPAHLSRYAALLRELGR
jgi:DNA-binding transcriptional regulator YiaG